MKKLNWILFIWFLLMIIISVIGMVFTTPANATTPQQHMRCLALNIYHEARNQSLEGQLAVGYVTLNRVRSKRFPNNICQVVKQHKQFSWYSDGLPDTPREKLAWQDAKRHALYVVTHPNDDVTKEATHYHATWIKAPYWAYNMIMTAWIDDHIFYKRRI